jgi:hypothetical protein
MLAERAGKENFLPASEEVGRHAMWDEVLRLRGVLARTGGYASGHELQDQGQLTRSTPILNDAKIGCISIECDELR